MTRIKATTACTGVQGCSAVVDCWYALYGLRIHSNVAIPGLSSIDTHRAADLYAIFGEEPCSVASRLEQAIPYYTRGDGEDNLELWESAARDLYRIVTGSGLDLVWDRSQARLWINWSESASFDEAVFCFLGLFLGFLLRREGFVCLHASAVNVDGRAVVFAGPSGAGKSTTAALMSILGCTVLSEELVVLTETPGGALAHSGYARVRLSPEATQALYGSIHSLPPLVAGWDKRCLELEGNEKLFQREPLPISVIYLLAERSRSADAPFVDSLPGRQALMGLVGNTYANSFLDSEMRRNEFEMLTRLVANVPVRRVTSHSGPERLRDLGQVILRDAREFVA